MELIPGTLQKVCPKLPKIGKIKYVKDLKRIPNQFIDKKKINMFVSLNVRSV